LTTKLRRLTSRFTFQNCL